MKREGLGLAWVTGLGDGLSIDCTYLTNLGQKTEKTRAFDNDAT